MSVKEWRRYRDQAGILVSMVVRINRLDKSLGKKAWKIYDEWVDWKIGFREAERKLKKLLEQARKI